jgi:hypothetical protein
VLADLDELLLRCRDERARAYISEALACYKAGAYRATIVSTWIAVTFDIIDKLRELTLAGDKAATEIIEEFDAITAADDVARAQRFERELLTVAKQKFELISAQEYVDLERLQADRHRCAHPSQSAVGEVFSPTAELARFHIRSAVEHLLQHEPAQGKAALDGILGTIRSQQFPHDEKKALVILGASPLKRARPSLVRNLTVVLLKGLLREERQWPVSAQREAALTCIRSLHSAQWIQVLQQNLTPLIRSLTSDDELLRAAKLLYAHPSLAEAVEEDQILRLSEFVLHLPKHHIESLPDFLEPGPLLSSARHRVNLLNVKEVAEICETAFAGPPPEVCDVMVKRYSAVTSFDSANEWAKLIQPQLVCFSSAQVKALLTAAVTNDQIQGSFQLPHLLAAVKKSTHHNDTEVAALVTQAQQLV